MSRPILVGFDPSSADHAPGPLRRPDRPGHPSAAHDRVVAGASAGELDEHDRRDAEEEIRQVVAELAADGPAEIEVRTGDPAETLIGLSQDVDALVCGSRGYGPLRAALLGSVTRRLAAEARCPLVVLPRGVKDSLESLFAESPGAAAQA
jgi:nucleotide-binding universal stress UspA family protein